MIIGVSFYSIRLFTTKNYLVNTSTATPVVLFIIILILIIVSATGDYWSYRLWYDTGRENLHFEPIWNTIRSIIPWGFNIFRLILWGGGLILFTIMCKWNKTDLILSYSLFILFYTFYYCYARATVAYMLLLFAYYLVVRLKENHYRRWPLSLLLAILCVWIGLQMHRSMLILLMILAFSLFVKPRKQTFIVLLLLFPIISLIFNTILYPYFMFSVVDEEQTILMDRYLRDKRGFNEFIKHLFRHLPILLLFFVSLINILKKKSVSPTVKKIAFCAFNIVYFSFLFYTIKAGNGLTLFYRTMNMAYPFMIMSIAYSLKCINNMYYLTLLTVTFKVLLTFLEIYQALINPDYLYNQVLERYYLG